MPNKNKNKNSNINKNSIHININTGKSGKKSKKSKGSRYSGIYPTVQGGSISYNPIPPPPVAGAVNKQEYVLTSISQPPQPPDARGLPIARTPFTARAVAPVAPRRTGPSLHVPASAPPLPDYTPRIPKKVAPPPHTLLEPPSIITIPPSARIQPNIVPLRADTIAPRAGDSVQDDMVRPIHKQRQSPDPTIVQARALSPTRYHQHAPPPYIDPPLHQQPPNIPQNKPTLSTRVSIRNQESIPNGIASHTPRNVRIDNMTDDERTQGAIDEVLSMTRRTRTEALIQKNRELLERYENIKAKSPVKGSPSLRGFEEQTNISTPPPQMTPDWRRDWRQGRNTDTTPRQGMEDQTYIGNFNHTPVPAVAEAKAEDEDEGYDTDEYDEKGITGVKQTDALLRKLKDDSGEVWYNLDTNRYIRSNRGLAKARYEGARLKRIS